MEKVDDLVIALQVPVHCMMSMRRRMMLVVVNLSMMGKIPKFAITSFFEMNVLMICMKIAPVEASGREMIRIVGIFVEQIAVVIVMMIVIPVFISIRVYRVVVIIIVMT